jgi:hypothetical protein
MPALTEPQLVGKKQDLSDMIYLADRKTTPGISAIKKGKPLTNMLYDVLVKSMGARKPLGVADGKDIGAFDSQNPKVTYQARGVVARRAIMVGFIAEAMANAGGVAGETSVFDEAEADQLIETKRDMEKALWGNQDSRADDGVNGSQARGMGRWIYDGSSTLTLDAFDTWSATTGYGELPVPATARTPGSQIYTGSIASMTEDQFAALIQAKYENTGASSDLRGFVTPIIKNRIGFFSRYQPTLGSYTSSVFVTSGKVQGNTLFGASVDVYKSDWGTFELFPVLTDFMPTSYTGFFLDMDHPRIRSAEMFSKKPLPDLMGGPREGVQSILSWFPGDPRAHAKIDGTA